MQKHCLKSNAFCFLRDASANIGLSEKCRTRRPWHLCLYPSRSGLAPLHLVTLKRFALVAQKTSWCNGRPVPMPVCLQPVQDISSKLIAAVVIMRTHCRIKSRISATCMAEVLNIILWHSSDFASEISYHGQPSQAN